MGAPSLLLSTNWLAITEVGKFLLLVVSQATYGHLMLDHRTLASYNVATNSHILVGRTNVSVDAVGQAQARQRLVRVVGQACATNLHSVPRRKLWVLPCLLFW